MLRCLYRSITIVSVVGFATCGALAADRPFVFGLPGNPPVFLSVLPYVAAEQGFFKKYGIEVELRPFDTGVTAARAASSGAIDLASAPSSEIINMVANGNLPLVGIYGLENPDWLIASTDPAIKSCKDLSGRQIAVDTFGGARSIALQQMIASCGIKSEGVLQGGVSSNVSAAMIAGTTKIGVLHLDDLAVIEEKTGKPLTIVMTMKAVHPDEHYNMFSTRRDRLAQDRQRYVKFIAALIDATAFMRDPKNWDRVAQIAAPTGRSPSEAKAALKKYLEIDFWPNGNDGLTEKKVETEIRNLVAIGGIRAGKKLPSNEKLIDHSVWQDAIALTLEK